MAARPRRGKLPARYAAILTPLVLSLLMTFIVSFISTLKSLGFDPDLPSIWMTAWGLSWLVAFPTLILVLPMVRRIVGVLCEPARR
ncbi:MULTISPECIES: DUF2798 domain-containing protein [unclassified Mesorhizobium]|uniref:DUF2798 domain-containing protein n=1 Tax=unclassified Mesorhizobium TaxID=325217 RepID=UPI00112B298D|nr:MULTISPECIES: DUF2798 domain-containing protein [unclassified Mesorhizobium]MBZ9742926.1 DUF2798 domain-containing protein [Mesorhizobium sp. CO1-1-4]MBZ9805878.1 DUF2798 domain-containing protein [Mesorhizobium sp. ES1-6]TPL82397.1 DUF2798 domain-containing protein [Mesorhizobium sp. B2-3-12]